MFANRFRREALLPEPPTRDFGVFVTESTAETIRLVSTDPALRTHPGVLGVYWGGGYGQVDEIIDESASGTTRRFRLLSGEIPAPGTEVDLEGWAYPADPSDVGLEWVETTFLSEIGALGTWLVPAEGATTWAIHVHGWRASRREALRMLPVYDRAGITSMVIDYRNDPAAPADPSGHYRFGLSEWEDVEAAVEYALSNGAEQIILTAYSTGAAAAMAFMERSSKRDRVVGLVFDAPNINMAEAVHHAAAEMQLPLIPLPMPRSVTSVTMAIADARWHVGWRAIDYLSRADQLKVPVLVFHGKADQRVPVSVSRALHHANPEHVELVIVPDAGHVMSWNADPRVYEARLGEFLRTL